MSLVQFSVLFPSFKHLMMWGFCPCGVVAVGWLRFGSEVCSCGGCVFESVWWVYVWVHDVYYWLALRNRTAIFNTFMWSVFIYIIQEVSVLSAQYSRVEIWDWKRYFREMVFLWECVCFSCQQPTWHPIFIRANYLFWVHALVCGNFYQIFSKNVAAWGKHTYIGYPSILDDRAKLQNGFQ